MMRRTTPVAASIIALAATAGRAHAADSDRQATRSPADMQIITKDLSEMRTNTVRATDILRDDVTNGLNAMGTVQDLVLSNDASRVEYVIFNTGVPWTITPGPGYLPFNQVDLEKGSTL